ncbi:uncharacterized protein [Anabrus simplex]|uniref:uncharacterized protein n=1 Tax=Anabrus simplex TaxID=316456 RepID=UPI0035A304D5
MLNGDHKVSIMKAIAVAALVTQLVCAIPFDYFNMAGCPQRCARCHHLEPGDCTLPDVFVVDGDDCGCCDACLPFFDYGSPYSVNNNKTTCQMDFNLLYEVHCNSLGEFLPVQCSNFHCWCAHPHHGQPVASKVPVNANNLNATTCKYLLALSAKLTKEDKSEDTYIGDETQNMIFEAPSVPEIRVHVNSAKSILPDFYNGQVKIVFIGNEDVIVTLPPTLQDENEILLHPNTVS